VLHALGKRDEARGFNAEAVTARRILGLTSPDGSRLHARWGSGDVLPSAVEQRLTFSILVL
jgi:hypothetical protein